MALEDLATSPADILLELGKIGRWIQAIGLVIILWLIFHIIVLINNRIKRKKLYAIEERLQRIENMLKQIAKQKRKK